MHRILSIVVSVAVAMVGSLNAEDAPSKKMPDTAESIAAVKKSMFKGFGTIKSAHFDNGDQEIFVVWCCPFSGRNACYVHGYYLEPGGGKWVRFLSALEEGSHDISAMIACREDDLVIFDFKGKEIRRVDVGKLGIKE